MRNIRNHDYSIQMSNRLEFNNENDEKSGSMR